MTRPSVSKTRWIPFIWILPFLAALIGGWLVNESILESGVEIHIVFNNAEGLKEGKTRIIYKGIKVGLVKDMHISKDMQQVEVIADIDHDAVPGLKTNTVFWLVKPKVTMTGITGLDTLVAGNYIRMRPGPGKDKRDFTALSKPPSMDVKTPGLHINVIADQLGSVDRGSPVYYRKIPVGKVLDYSLPEDLNGVIIKILIEEEYTPLIQTNTRFWNASGLSIKAGLTGVSIQTESIAALIAGGIAFYTPDQLETEPARSGQTFKLYKDFDSAQVGISVKILFESGIGLVEGKTQVKHEGFKIGVVKKLNHRHKGKYIVADVLFDPIADELLKVDTKFWLVKPKFSLSGVSGLNTLFQGNYIDVQVGDGKSARKFTALSKPPLITSEMNGLHLVLKANELGSLEQGSPVSFKQIQVGHVQDYQLAEDGRNVLIDIYIREPYTHLVAKGSRFWNTSGVDLNVSTAGMKIRTGSLRSILTGGIEFITASQSKQKVLNGAVYTLYDDYNGATENGLLVRKTSQGSLNITIQTDDLGSLNIGTKVFYQKIPVGEVTHYQLSKNNSAVILSVQINKRYRHLVKKQSRFWRSSGISIEGGLSGVKIRTASLNAVLNGGISFYTPDDGERYSAAGNNEAFSLFDDFDTARENGFPIQVVFELADGIEAGTLIKYRGIEVGKVKRVQLSNNHQGIIVDAVLFGFAKEFARSGTRFQLIGPSLGLFITKHLETLVQGKYIEILPGKGSKSRYFSGSILSIKSQNGLHIVLKSQKLGSIKPGNPVYYKQMPVGVVTGFRLSPSATHVLIDLSIDGNYEKLVRKNSKFWNVSGVEMDFGLFSGAVIKAETIESIVSGGVAFATPEDGAGNMAEASATFQLHPQAEEEWLAWSPVILGD